jgi:hypothetical protein
MLLAVREAVVDASSLIYMLKAGFLERLSFTVKFWAPPEAIAETGWRHLPVWPRRPHAIGPRNSQFGADAIHSERPSPEAPPGGSIEGSFEDSLSELPPADGPPPDDLVLALADEMALPLVSEDRELLMRAEEARLPYFNALMMLMLLYGRARCDREEFGLFWGRLAEIGHYSDWVLSFAERVAEHVFLLRESL